MDVVERLWGEVGEEPMEELGGNFDREREKRGERMKSYSDRKQGSRK